MSSLSITSLMFVEEELKLNFFAKFVDDKPSWLTIVFKSISNSLLKFFIFGSKTPFVKLPAPIKPTDILFHLGI